MATHSSILAWEIPWTEEPGGLQFMGSRRIGHDLATKQQYSTHNTQVRLLKVSWGTQRIWQFARGSRVPEGEGGWRDS